MTLLRARRLFPHLLAYQAVNQSSVAGVLHVRAHMPARSVRPLPLDGCRMRDPGAAGIEPATSHKCGA